MVLGQFKERLFVILDEQRMTSDLQRKLIPSINMGLNEIIVAASNRKKYKIVQADIMDRYTLKNPLYNFQVVNHYDQDIVYESDRAKAYYFAVNLDAVVYIEVLTGGVWTVVETITHAATDGFTAYKGLIPKNTAPARIRFSGDSYYNLRNVAMWDISFPTVENVPNFQEYSDYKMPPDFYKVESIFMAGSLGENKPFSDYRWETPKTLRLNYYSFGEFIIEYNAYYPQVPANATDLYELELMPEYESALLNYVAKTINTDDELEPLYASRYNNAMVNLAGNFTQVATVQGGIEFV